MKNSTKYSIGFFLMTIMMLVIQSTLTAQTCNVNEKYDKIVSGYHQSIALTSDGSYSVWGQEIANNGTSDHLVPATMNVANFPNLVGSPLKAAIGGGAGSTKEQQILLTTDGLYAWGTRNYVLATSLTAATTFAKINTPIGGDANTKLPTGVNPTSVIAMTASYQTLMILTSDGYVWVLTQAGVNAQGDGSASVAATTWHKVKIDASTDLTGVIAVRCQVSSSSYNAFMALTSSGQVYTWGTTAYLGAGAASTSKSFATLMTLPAEFTSSYIPKMIGVTGGIKGTNSTKNTYYLLGNNGTLWAMGDNTKKQCGDFTVLERRSWVKVQKSGTANDFFTNINFFSAQEHDAAFPGIAAITTTGVLYSWGESDGASLGYATNGTYDPAVPGGFAVGTDKAISTEVGGHTLVYIKEGSSNFCYVGHKTNGSMGDNVAASSNVNTFNCSGTPVLEICGYVPKAAAPNISTITAAQTKIWGDGTSTTTITIQLKEANGTNLTVSGGTVTVYSTHGPLGTVVDNNNGTYTVILTSVTGFANTLLTFDVNGVTSTSTATVTYAGLLPLTWNNVNAYRQGQTVKVEWSTEQERDISHFVVERSLNGSLWIPLPFKIPAANKTTVNNYQVIDRDYIAQQTFFRIKQVGMDGQSTYSTVKTVYAEKATSNLIVYPVPATNKFYIGNIPANQLKEIKMINENGTMVKRWTSLQVSYDIHDIATGIYYLKIETKDGSVEQVRLTKL